MKRISIFMSLLYVAVLCVPAQELFRQEGIGSWYGPGFDGRPTASGETFDSNQFTAAHPDLPFGTLLLVTNKHNSRQVTVRVNDRGPFVASRIVDVSKAAAEQLDMIVTGTAPVVIETLPRSASVTPPAMPAPAPTYMEAPVYTQPYTQQVYPEYTPPAYTQSVYPEYTQPAQPYTQPYTQQVYPEYTPPVYTQQVYPEYTQPYAQPYTQSYAQPVYPETYTQAPPSYSNSPYSSPAYSSPVYPEAPAYTYVPPASVMQTPPALPIPIVESYSYAPPPISEMEAAAMLSSIPEARAPEVLAPPAARAGVKLIPAIEPQADKTYKLQIGSYKDPRSAVAAYEKLRNVGLGPSYERYGDFYRVVLAGVRGNEVKSVADKLDTVGFHEALIREDR